MRSENMWIFQHCWCVKNSPLLKQFATQVIVLFNFYHFCITPRPFCWTNTKLLRYSPASNKVKNLGKWKQMHLMTNMGSSRECIIIFKPSSLVTERDGAVCKILEFLPENANDIINTFCHDYFVWTGRGMQFCNNIVNQLPPITIVSA